MAGHQSKSGDATVPGWRRPSARAYLGISDAYLSVTFVTFCSNIVCAFTTSYPKIFPISHADNSR